MGETIRPKICEKYSVSPDDLSSISRTCQLHKLFRGKYSDNYRRPQLSFRSVFRNSLHVILYACTLVFVSLNHKRIRTSSFLAQRPFARAIKIGFVLAMARKYTFVFPVHEISCVRVCASTCVYYRSFYTGFSQAAARIFEFDNGSDPQSRPRVCRR